MLHPCTAEFIEVPSLNGDIEVSRALGDPEFKLPQSNQCEWFPPSGHGEVHFTADLVIGVPEIVQLTIDVSNILNKCYHYVNLVCCHCCCFDFSFSSTLLYFIIFKTIYFI